MIVTEDNIDNITYFEGGSSSDNANRKLLQALLGDLKDLNDLLDRNNKSDKHLVISYIDQHTEYSPERVDPCPDYYGMFKLVFENNHSETIGEPFGLWDLHTIIFVIYDFITSLEI